MRSLDRRDWLRTAAISLLGCSASGWLPKLAAQVVGDPRRRRHCILLWMSGGASQTDTFDMKPHHENGGEFKEIATNVSGIRISEHLPQLARHADKLAMIRSLSTKEGDHERGTLLMRIGMPQPGPMRNPAVAPALAKALSAKEDVIPPYICIAPNRGLARAALSPGFLGPKFAPLIVGTGNTGGTPFRSPSEDGGARPTFADLRVTGFDAPPGLSEAQVARRQDLWKTIQGEFVARQSAAGPKAQNMMYEGALQLIHSGAGSAFNLGEEPEAVRTRYGNGAFGQGCLMARRLVERGVPFVEVSSTGNGGIGWDTHGNNFNQVKSLSQELDAGWATLMTDLAERGLLDSTTIIWMGEFGRTPKINANAGRDHFPQAWSCVLGGGGVAGGQAFGRTSADGTTVEEDPVGATDILATLCQAIGVPPETEIMSESGRPFKIVEGSAIQRLLS